MPNIYCSDWDEGVGVCTLHYIPMIPCPQCLAEKNPHIQVHITEVDWVYLDWDDDLSLKDFLPAGHEWLLDRVY